MNDCPNLSRIGAYHDGELNAADRAAVAAHLQSCDACAAELRRLEAMSQWFAQDNTHLPSIVSARLHNRADTLIRSANENAFVRIAWSLSGVAASILVIGSAWLMKTNDTPEAAPPWVGVTAVASVSDSDAAREPATPAAAWYLADASTRSDFGQ